MKKNAIARIVLFSCTIILLSGILAAGVFGSFYRKNNAVLSIIQATGESQISNYSAPGESHASSYSAPAHLSSIEIDWVSGSITVQPGDVNGILIEEFGAEESQKMVVKETENSVQIHYCKEGLNFPSFGININGSKELVITVPHDWTGRELDVDSASAVLVVKNLSFLEVDVDEASGECSFENCSITDLNVDTASGDIHYSGTLNTLDFDAASASFKADLLNIPSQMEMDSASGNLDVTLPENAGFTLSIDAMSSDFSTDFDTTSQKGRYVCGNGRCRIDVSGMSGDVNLRKCKDQTHTDCHSIANSHSENY